jgi:serine/threonine-protein kinase HipA
MSKQLKVLYDGQLSGYLSETDEGYDFSYTDEYLATENARPVSLTFPLQKSAFRSTVLFPFFDGLIPEGWLLEIAMEHWKLNPRDRFELLTATCRDTIGAVTVEPKE